MTNPIDNESATPGGDPSPEGVTGDPGAAGPLEAGTERESGLALGDTEEQAGGYGTLDGGELADSVDAGTLSGAPEQGAIPASPAPERHLGTLEGGDRGQL
ncbi:MAG: hypothetical protein ABR541_05340 [Candidatus Dormibacteria bacterium]